MVCPQKKSANFLRTDKIRKFLRTKNFRKIFLKKFFNFKKEENTIKLLKIFISSNISQISSFLTKFQDFKHSLLLWLGDLYRYSFIYSGEDKRDFTICEQCYVNAAFCDPKNWKPYSQVWKFFFEIFRKFSGKSLKIFTNFLKFSQKFFEKFFEVSQKNFTKIFK